MKLNTPGVSAGRVQQLIDADEVNKPFIVAFKDVTVLTTGTPADVATVTLPSWCTRYRLMSSGSHFCIAESAAGTLAAASFSISPIANGGTAIVTSFSGPASTSVVVLPVATGTTIVPSTGNTLYLRQSGNSANAGVISVYLTIMPLL